MAISRAQLLKELEPGLNALFGMEYERYGDEHTEIYSLETSNKAYEEDVKLSGFGAAQVKEEGAPTQFDSAQEAWSVRYVPQVISMGFAITEEAMDDNLYDSLSKRYTKAMAYSMAYTKQVKAAEILNNGFSSFQTGDGVSLFNDAHPLNFGGSNANRPTVATDLNETSLEQAVIDIADYRDDRNLPIAVRPMKLILPAALQFVAARLLSSNLRVSTADNDINALRSTSAIPEGYVINHYLSDPTSWYLKTSATDGFKYFQRKAMQTKMDGDFDTGNVRYKASERYSFGVTEPLAMYASKSSY
jgi:hypothetical protein